MNWTPYCIRASRRLPCSLSSWRGLPSNRFNWLSCGSWRRWARRSLPVSPRAPLHMVFGIPWSLYTGQPLRNQLQSVKKEVKPMSEYLLELAAILNTLATLEMWLRTTTWWLRRRIWAAYSKCHEPGHSCNLRKGSRRCWPTRRLVSFKKNSCLDMTTNVIVAVVNPFVAAPIAESGRKDVCTVLYQICKRKGHGVLNCYSRFDVDKFPHTNNSGVPRQRKSANVTQYGPHKL